MHPTGSLKHRLARSLFLYALCNGWIDEGTTVIEASSGLDGGLRGVLRPAARAAVRRGDAGVPPRAEKIELIEFHGGRCHLVDDPRTMYDEARRLAAETGGHYMDQFTYAERATDWRGNNNIAESIFEQLRAGAAPGARLDRGRRRHRRHLRDHRPLRALPAARHPGLRRRPGELARSSRAGRPRDPTYVTGRGSRIEGIGRPRVEPSLRARRSSTR